MTIAHYKEINKSQGLFLSVNLSEQIVSGTFEFTLNPYKKYRNSLYYKELSKE